MTTTPKPIGTSKLLSIKWLETNYRGVMPHSPEGLFLKGYLANLSSLQRNAERFFLGACGKIAGGFTLEKTEDHPDCTEILPEEFRAKAKHPNARWVNRNADFDLLCKELDLSSETTTTLLKYCNDNVFNSSSASDKKITTFVRDFHGLLLPRISEQKQSEQLKAVSHVRSQLERALSSDCSSINEFTQLLPTFPKKQDIDSFLGNPTGSKSGLYHLLSGIKNQWPERYDRLSENEKVKRLQGDFKKAVEKQVKREKDRRSIRTLSAKDRETLLSYLCGNDRSTYSKRLFAQICKPILSRIVSYFSNRKNKEKERTELINQLKEPSTSVEKLIYDYCNSYKELVKQDFLKPYQFRNINMVIDNIDNWAKWETTLPTIIESHGIGDELLAKTILTELSNWKKINTNVVKKAIAFVKDQESIRRKVDQHRHWCYAPPQHSELEFGDNGTIPNATIKQHQKLKTTVACDGHNHYTNCRASYLHKLMRQGKAVVDESGCIRVNGAIRGQQFPSLILQLETGPSETISVAIGNNRLYKEYYIFQNVDGINIHLQHDLTCRTTITPKVKKHIKTERVIGYDANERNPGGLACLQKNNKGSVAVKGIPVADVINKQVISFAQWDSREQRVVDNSQDYTGVCEYYHKQLTAWKQCEVDVITRSEMLLKLYNDYRHHQGSQGGLSATRRTLVKRFASGFKSCMDLIGNESHPLFIVLQKQYEFCWKKINKLRKECRGRINCEIEKYREQWNADSIVREDLNTLYKGKRKTSRRNNKIVDNMIYRPVMESMDARSSWTDTHTQAVNPAYSSTQHPRTGERIVRLDNVLSNDRQHYLSKYGGKIRYNPNSQHGYIAATLVKMCEEQHKTLSELLEVSDLLPKVGGRWVIIDGEQMHADELAPINIAARGIALELQQKVK